MHKETKSFLENFAKYKNKKIVFYGIGMTAQAVLAEIIPMGWTIVGLLDRDMSNIGTERCGIPVISYETAEKLGDMVIIMSDQSHYETIYRRIMYFKIPIFYRSGVRAKLTVTDDSYSRHKYWKTTRNSVLDRISGFKYVSFDFFDTLVMRNVYEPQDVFKLLERRLIRHNHAFSGFAELRETITSKMQKKYPTLKEIYAALGEVSDLSEQELDYAMNEELCIESEVMVPRTDMIDLFKETIALGKEVYVVSDMYLDSDFLFGKLKEYGVETFNRNCIIVSCEAGCSKEDGLWEFYCKNIINGHPALHIGDNYLSDIEMPKKCGIDTLYVMSGIDLLKHSSAHSIIDHAITLNDSLCVGMFIASLFNSPFCLSESKGLLRINDFNDLGYCAFGGIFDKFFDFLITYVENRDVDRILFFARDGYFLKEDFEKYCEYCNIVFRPKTVYVPVSRRLLLVASIRNEEDFYETVKYPFTGAFSDYMKIRFNIKVNDDIAENNEMIINAENDYELILDNMKPYMDKIWHEIEAERNNYITYLCNHGILDSYSNDLLVDLGYKGTTQYLFEKAVGRQYPCAYFLADFSSENPYHKKCDMQACFNDQNIPDGYSTLVGKHALFIESFLTAPYGNIDYIKGNGEISYGKLKMNQKFFDEKILINDGIIKYLQTISDIRKSSRGGGQKWQGGR